MAERDKGLQLQQSKKSNLSPYRSEQYHLNIFECRQDVKLQYVQYVIQMLTCGSVLSCYICILLLCINIHIALHRAG